MSTQSYLSPYNKGTAQVLQNWRADRDILFTTRKKILNIAKITFFAVFTAVWPLIIKDSITLISTKGKFARGTVGLVVSLINFVSCAILLVNSIRNYFHQRKALAAADRFVNHFTQKALRNPLVHFNSLNQMKPDFQGEIDKLVLKQITKECKGLYKRPNSPYFYYLYPQILTSPLEEVVIRLFNNTLFR